MLEFFASTYIVNKMNNNKKKENRKIKELFKKDEEVSTYLTKKSINGYVFAFVIGIISLSISIYSAKLALQCNYGKGDLSKVSAGLFGFFFSGMYLSYYFVWHKLLGNKC